MKQKTPKEMTHAMSGDDAKLTFQQWFDSLGYVGMNQARFSFQKVLRTRVQHALNDGTHVANYPFSSHSHLWKDLYFNMLIKNGSNQPITLGQLPKEKKRFYLKAHLMLLRIVAMRWLQCHRRFTRPLRACPLVRRLSTL